MHRSKNLARLSALLVIGGCSAPPPAAEPEGVDYTSKSGEGDDLGALFGVSSAAIGVAVPSCSAQASSGFVASTGVFTLTLNQANTTEVIIATVGTTLRVNGYTCVDNAGTPIDLTKLTKLVVNGTSGDDAVVLDLYLGAFNAKTTGTGGGGVVLALGAGGMDRVGIRGTSGVDTFTAGAHTGRAFVDFTGDGVADAMWTSTATRRELMLATAGGNDFLSGSGRATTTAAGATSATATLAGAAVAAGNIGALTSAFRLSAYGGPGNDRLQGGDGDDLLDGGDGDDTFFTAASADGADIYLGGLGTDTVDYSARTANLSLTIALTSAADANDGAAGENDDLTASIENLTGGSGSDVLKGSAVSNVLRGGAGNDVLWSGPGGTCTADVDQLFGDAGDDTFEMGAALDCGDDLTGGAGNDVATYHDRANALTVSRDDAANDGEATEKDNVRADVEVLVGGQGADTLSGGTVAAKILGCAGNDVITGSSASDELSGGPGDDVVNGGAGNDTFLEHGDEPLCFSSVRSVTSSLRGLGSDVLNGGAGIEDKLDYSGRTAALTVTLCVDSAAATGVGTCGNPRNDGEAGEGDAILNTEILEAGSGNDVVTGSSADEWIYGNGGDDTLSGLGGNDHLDGGPGANTVTGGNGADICQNYVQANACDLHVYTCITGTKRDCDRLPENACETDVQTSAQHCGACGNACGVGQACQAGACVSNTCGGSGTFAFSSTAGPSETVGNQACDLDRDGFDDAIFVNQLAGTVSIYWGGVQAGLSAPTVLSTGRAGGATACADFDNDGATDLLVTRQDSGNFIVFGQSAPRTFGSSTTTGGLIFPSAVTTLDANGDGFVDVLLRTGGTSGIGSSAVGTWLILPGRGDRSFNGAQGGFTTVSGEGYWFADLDGDGRVEAIGGTARPYAIRHIQPNGALQTVATFDPVGCPQLETVTRADVNRDGRDDLVLQCNGTLIAYQSTGTFQFAPCTVGMLPSTCGMAGSSACYAGASLDFNNDGRLDFIASATCGFCSSMHFLGLGQ